ncbi:MAG: peptidase U32 family protein [Alphaproteobacteria bacterium]
MKPELLVPGGSLDKIKVALMYGADAVYAGVPDLSLREKAKLSYEEVDEAIKLAHKMGKRMYLAFNIFSHNKDLPKVPKVIEMIKKLNPDGLIISDPGIFMMVHKALPDMPLHVSTQANVCSYETIKFWENMGAKLCVLAREVSFEEIKEIRKECPDIRLEMFIHGAMCMSYSGRCLLSNYMTGRGANQGNCAQSCRWKYRVYEKSDQDEAKYFLEEDKRKDEFMPIIENDRGTFIMSSKDLCLMPRLPEVIEAGIDVLKLEGRNKSAYYVATVTRAYRAALDSFYADPENFNFEPFQAELDTLQNRGYTYGFFDGVPDGGAQTYESTRSDGDWRTAGLVISQNENGLELELKNSIIIGDDLYLLSPARFEPYKINLSEIVEFKTGEQKERLSAGQQQSILIKKEWLPENWQTLFPRLAMARKKI